MYELVGISVSNGLKQNFDQAIWESLSDGTNQPKMTYINGNKAYDKSQFNVFCEMLPMSNPPSSDTGK